MKKALIIILAMTMALCIGIGATLAYLFVDTKPVTNTFKYGDINITLTESENLDLKMIPGNTIFKDPKVTVLANSEACWLFVKIDESANFGNFMTYGIADGWTRGNGTDIPANVYYREVEATNDSAAPFPILADNEVFVKGDVLKTELNALTDTTLPTLTFTAYAVQRDTNINSAVSAWGLVKTNYLTANP